MAVLRDRNSFILCFWLKDISNLFGKCEKIFSVVETIFYVSDINRVIETFKDHLPEEHISIPTVCE